MSTENSNVFKIGSLIDFDEKYPGALKADNVDNVLQSFRAKKLLQDDSLK